MTVPGFLDRETEGLNKMVDYGMNIASVLANAGESAGSNSAKVLSKGLSGIGAAIDVYGVWNGFSDGDMGMVVSSGGGTVLQGLAIFYPGLGWVAAGAGVTKLIINTHYESEAEQARGRMEACDCNRLRNLLDKRLLQLNVLKTKMAIAETDMGTAILNDISWG